MRTPLSVISNEVSYLESMVPPSEELGLSKEKIKQMSEILKFKGFLRDVNATTELVELVGLVRQITQELERKTDFELEAPETLCQLNPSHLRFVLISILELFPLSEHVSVYIGRKALSFATKAPFANQVGNLALLSNVAPYFCSDYIPAPLADTIILANGWSLEASFSSERCIIRLKLNGGA